jgi:hypothetical protein
MNSELTSAIKIQRWWKQISKLKNIYISFNLDNNHYYQNTYVYIEELSEIKPDINTLFITIKKSDLELTNQEEIESYVTFLYNGFNMPYEVKLTMITEDDTEEEIIEKHKIMDNNEEDTYCLLEILNNKLFENEDL